MYPIVLFLTGLMAFIINYSWAVKHVEPKSATAENEFAPAANISENRLPILYLTKGQIDTLSAARPRKKFVFQFYQEENNLLGLCVWPAKKKNQRFDYDGIKYLKSNGMIIDTLNLGGVLLGNLEISRKELQELVKSWQYLIFVPYVQQNVMGLPMKYLSYKIYPANIPNKDVGASFTEASLNPSPPKGSKNTRNQ